LVTNKSEAAKAQALAGYLDPGPKHLNCAQAVMLDGLLVLDLDPGLIAVGSFLGGGMARMGQVCGALSGAAVALGLRKQFSSSEQATESNDTFGRLQGLFSDFQARFGATTCRELTGCDISSAEGFRAAKRRKALARCPEFVSWTCDRLNEMLGQSA
jgi:C_GCAxxG_C_C family probable redox protein